MPKSSSTPPREPMTWARATPILFLAILFDALRMMFEMFWFFGPAIAAIFCTFKVTSAIGTSAVATKGAALVCGAAGTAVGIFAVEVIEPFGVVMATATGLIGWLVIGLTLIMTNPRIFKENEGATFRFVVSLLISEIPIIGTIPSFSITVWRMYRTQIDADRLAAKKAKGTANEGLARRQLQQAAARQIMASRNAQAANDAQYTQELEKAA